MYVFVAHLGQLKQGLHLLVALGAVWELQPINDHNIHARG